MLFNRVCAKLAETSLVKSATRSLASASGNMARLTGKVAVVTASTEG